MRAAPVATWTELGHAAPQIATTMRRYLQQVSCSLRPQSIKATDQGLRLFATFLTRAHPDVTAIADLQRVHLENYKRWLTDDLDHPTAGPGRSLSATSRSLRLGSLRMFFTRITEWDYDDAPSRPLLFLGDLPPRDQPLPKALDDADAARFLRAAQAQPRLLTRAVAEVLIRTGLRVGEFCDLSADAVRTGHERLLAARPGRQAPRRPLPAAAPRARRSHR
jgi:site-specific recombinase XerD